MMGMGDCLSMKQICDICMNKSSDTMMIKDDLGNIVHKKTAVDDFLAKLTFNEFLETYYEFPPIFRALKYVDHWGTPLLNTKNETDVYKELSLSGTLPTDENTDFRNICYLKLREHTM